MSDWQFERWMVTLSEECSADAGWLRAGKKKIASDFISAGGLQPPSTEGLTRSRRTLPRTYQQRKACRERGL